MLRKASGTFTDLETAASLNLQVDPSLPSPNHHSTAHNRKLNPAKAPYKMPFSPDALSRLSLVSTHLVGIVSFVIVCVWSLYFRGGVAWVTETTSLIFNWHPILMIAYVVLAGEAILFYRTIPTNRILRKNLHASVNGLALLFGIIGIYAAFRYHNLSSIANLYSLHSWFGMITIVLFGVQWLLGFATFLYPGGDLQARQRFMPWHTFLGLFVYILALTTATQGILEKLTFLIVGSGLGKRCAEVLLANALGVLTFVLGGLVIFTATQRDKVQDEAYRPLA